ncbi:MAG: phasin family protein [Betaproteobacteria bacterium]|nr:phasin family protein [Betaproteobacteria bacterium]
MVKVPEQFAEMNKSSIETALRFAKVSMDSAERLVKLQLEAAKAALDDNAKNAKALLEAKDPQEVLALRTQLAEHSVENAIAYSRNVYEVASQTQAELTQLLEERLETFNQGVAGAMDKAGAQVPPGADFAVAAVKSMMAATAAAVDSMTKAGKQMAGLAEASVKATTQATAEAVKGATKGTRGK